MRIYSKVEKLLFRLDEKGIRFTKRYKIVYAVAWIEDWLDWKMKEIRSKIESFIIKDFEKLFLAYIIFYGNIWYWDKVGYEEEQKWVKGYIVWVKNEYNTEYHKEWRFYDK